MKRGTGPRRKGHDFERKIAALLRDTFPDARRCLQYQRAHAVADVHAGPLRVECKAGHRVNVARVYREHARQLSGSVVAVVATKGHRGAPLVTLSLADLLWLMEPHARGGPVR